MLTERKIGWKKNEIALQGAICQQEEFRTTFQPWTDA